MSTPTPPEGYRIVEQSEIPIVPEGALHCCSHETIFCQSGNVGITPSPLGTYAIPIVKDDAAELAAMTIKGLQLKNKMQVYRIKGLEDEQKGLYEYCKRAAKNEEEAKAQIAELKASPPMQINARDNLSDDVEVIKHVVFEHSKALKAIKEAMKGI